MLIPNNPDLDFKELNRRIEAEVERYQLNKKDNRALPPFDPSPADLANRPYGWNQLVQLDDEPLVRAAYPTLLGRKAENNELQQQLHKLRSGWDKFEVLAELRYSPEGVAHNADVQGLRRARLKNTVRRIPVIGKLVMIAYGLLQIEQRNRYYVARLDLLTRQNRSHNSELLAQRDQNQHQHAAHHHHLHLQAVAQEEQAKSLSSQQKVLEDHYQALQQQSVALQQQDQTLHQQHDLIVQLQAELLQSRNVQQELRARLGLIERQPRSAPAAIASDSTAPAITASNAPQQHQSGIPDSFYLAFENHFRGDAETIRERQSYYLPILDAIEPLKAGLPLVDIGCGRGEWLQQLPSSCTRIGIDLNSMNVQTCLDQGLTAYQQDAMVWLANQPENSLAAVTAFHVIEHLTFEQFNTLLDECLRVLAPGGAIIFETPNPENIGTAAHYFWMDPTHLHPLPPAFTEFLVEYKGFDQVQIHRLQPYPEEHTIKEDSEVARRYNTLFYGPQDYSVVASKRLV